jgi:hypothetical protein
MARTCPETGRFRGAWSETGTTRVLLAALALASAAGCHSAPDSTIASGFATPELAGRGRAAYHVVRRTCDDQPFGEDFDLVPLETCVYHPGVETPDCTAIVSCLGPEDCTERAFGRCLGIDFSGCVYPDGAQTDVSCQSDTECTRAPGGHCRKAFAVLGCQYENQCGTNTDCAAGHRCACDGDGDLACVEATCLGDADCGAGNRCRQSYSCTGELTGAFSCTTAEDLCASDADCPADGGLRVCDNVAGRWQCTSFESCILP